MTPEQRNKILHTAERIVSLIALKCPDKVLASESKLLAAAELEALTKEVERLKQLHITDMRVTNESADYHMKRCDSLRTQNRELREALQRVWDDDECGYIIDRTGFKECVKCGAKLHLKEQHTEECSQYFIEQALATEVKP